MESRDSMNLNSHGNIYSIELLFTIIIIVLILITGFNLINIALDLINTNVDMEKLETISNKAVDSLIKSPGNPSNWEGLSNKNNSMPGLLKEDKDKLKMNIISYKKIMELKNNYYLMDNMFSNQIDSQISIYPRNNRLKPIIIGENPDFTNPKNIISIERYVSIDYFTDYKIKNINKSDYACNRNHNANWTCTYFTIENDLDNYDYFILEDKKRDTQYVLDNGINQTKIKNLNNIPLNEDLKFLNSNNASLIIIHIREKDFNGILISVPKNFNKEYLKYEYFNEALASLNLKTWFI